MARIEVSCTKCGAKFVGRNIDEAVQWSDGHDMYCIGDCGCGDETRPASDGVQ